MKTLSRGMPRIFAFVMVMGLTACSLPRGAATQIELTDDKRVAEAEVSVYQVSRDLLPKVNLWSRGVGQEASWPPKHGSGRTRIKANDTVDIVVWDNDANSLLTTLGQKSITLENVLVTPNGDVFLPYVGKVRVGGMSPDAARAKVQEGFEAIIPAVQVQLKLNPGSRNSVNLVAGMRTPGSYPMGLDGMTVLDALSLGGGAETGLRNPRMRLQRQGKSYAISLSHLYEAPAHNIRVRGNDKLIIEEDRRTFVALGAAGAEKFVYFEKDRITALEAVSIIGGLEDTRADAEGVLVLRTYPKFATNRSTYEPEFERVVFIMNLASAEGLFSAKEFRILPGDVVLATEAPIVKWTPALQFLQGLLNVGRRGQQVF